MQHLERDDPGLAGMVRCEEARLSGTLNLIAAESHAPRSIMEVLGSVLNTKTIEGYPGGRFHAGCVHADEVERLAIERGRALFGAEYLNVQPHSGTSANLAVYFAVLKVGDPILSMGLPQGGHLSHGHKASITGKCFSFSHYGVDTDTERIDYDRVREQALEVRPRMIVAGASSYPRLIDYEKMAGIAAEVSAMLLVDMAHIAGLVAAGVIPSPVPHSDFVTFTTYKTLMGGRGGVILCREKYGARIDRAVFPGCQGTSAVNQIAAKALTFRLAGEPAFREVQQKTLDTAVQMARGLASRGYRIVSGGTDNHQVLVDLSALGISGQAAETALEAAGLILNRNVVPADAVRPGQVSGLRLGTSAIASRGMDVPEVDRIVDMLDRILHRPDDETMRRDVRSEVGELCGRFPVY